MHRNAKTPEQMHAWIMRHYDLLRKAGKLELAFTKWHRACNHRYFPTSSSDFVFINDDLRIMESQ